MATGWSQCGERARQYRKEDEDEDEDSRPQAGLASRILSGPGLWLDRLEEIDRRGLVEELLAEGIIDQAVAPRRTATSWTGG